MKLLSVYNTNVAGQIAVIQAYLPLVRASSSHTPGYTPTIATIGSILGSSKFATALGEPSIAYGLSKAAVNFLNTAFAGTVRDVTFLSLHPGWVKTEMGTDAAPIEIPDSIKAIRTVLQKKTVQNTGEYINVITEDLLPY